MFSPFFQIENGECSWHSARLPLCILKTITTAISFKSFFWFPPHASDLKELRRSMLFPALWFFFFSFCKPVLNRKSLDQAGQVSCSPITVPNWLQNASTFVCTVNFIASTCFLKVLYTLLAPIIYCLSTFFRFIFCTLRNQCSKFNYATFLQFKWFFLSHIPSVCKKRNMNQRKVEKLDNKQQPVRCPSSYR